MTNALTDNRIQAQNVILWQYDKAQKFCSLVGLIEDQGKGATQQFWDYFIEKADDLTNADDFGLSVWGVLVGLSRPMLTYGGATVAMTTGLYRRVLKARVKFLQTIGSLGTTSNAVSETKIRSSISEYVGEIFGPNMVDVVDNYDMSITYSLHTGATFTDTSDGSLPIAAAELQALYMLSDYWQFYPAAVRDNGLPNALFFGFKAQHAAEHSAGLAFKTSGFGRSVFHPKTRTWNFYDPDGTRLEKVIEVSYTPSGAVVTEAATATAGSGSGISAVSVVPLVFGWNVNASGSYQFVYSTANGWKLNGNPVSLVDYGLSYTGTPVADGTITVAYTKGVGIQQVWLAKGTYIRKQTVDGVTAGATFTYDSTLSKWKDFGSNVVSLDEYGITYRGEPRDGETLAVTVSSDGYSVSYGTGTWSLKKGSTVLETCAGRDRTIWRDYGLSFDGQCVIAKWE